MISIMSLGFGTYPIEQIYLPKFQALSSLDFASADKFSCVIKLRIFIKCISHLQWLISSKNNEVLNHQRQFQQA